MEFLEVMNMLESSYKIPGGKLIKIKLWVESERIERLIILGDFFLHPEETIQAIEQALVGTTMDAGQIETVIGQVMKESDATLIGAEPKDISTAIMMAWESN